MNEYPLIITALSEEDGGGYLAVYPDLPGCMADGDTREEAVKNAADALACWMDVQIEREAEIPAPYSSSDSFFDKMEQIDEMIHALVETRNESDEKIKMLEAKIKSMSEVSPNKQPSMLANIMKATGRQQSWAH